MGQIKSALELALERTKDIEGSKSSLEAKELREQGMRLLVKHEAGDGFDLAAALKTLGKAQRPMVVAGIRQNLELALAIPAGPEAVERFRHKLAPVFILLSGEDPSMKEYMEQLPAFFQRYLDNREQVVQGVQRQYEPMLRRKEENLAKQTGRRVQLTFEQDPEYMAFLNKNLEGLNTQMGQVLDQIRTEITAILDGAWT